ncbi:hypothetical protein [Ruthenibacterium lactatiformans]|uniref:hypothetical protein n=1 Tax=Ruthenibacterium lactatiformans TaxID=1550024 RepID=UPI003AB5C772
MGTESRAWANLLFKIRRARGGFILNEKGVRHPFLAAFAAWLALCCAEMHGFATASFSPDSSFASLPFSTV